MPTPDPTPAPTLEDLRRDLEAANKKLKEAEERGDAKRAEMAEAKVAKLEAEIAELKKAPKKEDPPAPPVKRGPTAAELEDEEEDFLLM